MKVFIDDAEYDMIEIALINLGTFITNSEEKVKLTRIMQKLRAIHTLSPKGMLSVEPVK